jgi:hypothetical protein
MPLEINDIPIAGALALNVLMGFKQAADSVTAKV